MVLGNLAYRPFDGSITDRALDVLAEYGLAPSLIGRHVMIARLVGAAQEDLPGGERHLSTRSSRRPSSRGRTAWCARVLEKCLSAVSAPPVIIATPARRMQKDRFQAEHTIPLSHIGRQAS